jgi:hypothetical protein
MLQAVSFVIFWGCRLLVLSSFGVADSSILHTGRPHTMSCCSTARRDRTRLFPPREGRAIFAVGHPGTIQRLLTGRPQPHRNPRVHSRRDEHLDEHYRAQGHRCRGWPHWQHRHQLLRCLREPHMHDPRHPCDADDIRKAPSVVEPLPEVVSALHQLQQPRSRGLHAWNHSARRGRATCGFSVAHQCSGRRAMCSALSGDAADWHTRAHSRDGLDCGWCGHLSEL